MGGKKGSGKRGEGLGLGLRDVSSEHRRIAGN